MLVDPRPAPGELDDGARGPDGLTTYERFRIAHELGHLLFYDCSGGLWTRMRAADASEEAFCDAFARALLAPRNDAREAKESEAGQSTGHVVERTRHPAA